MTARRRRSTLWRIATAIGLCAAAIVLIAIALTKIPTTAQGPTVRDLQGNGVALDDAALTPEAEEAIAAVPDTGARLIAESVGLDVPLGALNEVDGVITPPGFTSAYLVRNRGVRPDDAAAGTVYAVTHSLRNGGTAPGNYLFDVESGEPTVDVGDVVEVDGTTYSVDKAYMVPKSELSQHAEIWADTPRRLVLITCLQTSGGTPSKDNVVIEAHLTDAS